MSLSRRDLFAGAAASLLDTARQGVAAERRPAPKDFLWGTAISAYQSEGNNYNSDAWLMENIQPTVFKERSGDACDSYHRYAEDIRLAASCGFNAYRFGLEWARIEPLEDFFSNAELDHYARVLEVCRSHGLKPVVTLNHFTTPLWFAARGGFEVEDSPDRFEAYCQTVAKHLGGLMHLVIPFNEANIQLLVRCTAQYAQLIASAGAMIAAAARITASPRFSRIAYADPQISTPLMQEAHRKAYAAFKAAHPGLPVGLSLTTADIQSLGPEAWAESFRRRLYGDWTELAHSHADFVGVQTYTRMRVDERGPVAPPSGAELTAAGYEFYPAALGNTIRWAHAALGKPVYVTENGIATDDDQRRIAFIDQALDGVRACLADGIDVRSYLYWSLLDNFEWTSGYGVRFGLAAVNRESFKRSLRPSARHLGAIARANLI